MTWDAKPLILAVLGVMLTATSAMAQATPPVHGILGNAPPDVSNTTAAGYSGPDSPSFTAGDPNVDSAKATVRLSVAEVNAAPTGTVTINAGKAKMTRSTAVLLTLTATDDGGGPIQMCISNTAKCLVWSAFARRKSWTIPSGNGMKKVNVWFRDQFGKTTPITRPYSDRILLDTKAPANGTVTAQSGIAQQLTLNWSGFTDGAGSGVSGYRVVFQKGSSPPSTCTAGTPVPKYVSPSTTLVHSGLIDGATYAYRVCAIDAVKNISSGATKIGRPIDSNPPAGTVTINGGAATTNSTLATLALTAVEDSGGAITMCISNTATCSAWTPFEAKKNWVLAPGSGITTVNVWFRDQVGNTSLKPNSDTIFLDTTKPTDGTVTATPGDSQLTLNWNGFTDTAGSGITGYRAVFQEGSAPSSCDSGTLVPGYAGTVTALVHTGLVNGTTYGYRVCAIDAAGNRSTGATETGQPGFPDTTPPTDGTVTATPGITQQLTLRWSGFADTGGSGIIGYRAVFQEGSAPSSCDAGTLILNGSATTTTLVHNGLINGTTYGYRVCATDAAGNTSTGATVSNVLVLPNCEVCHNGNLDYPLAPNVMRYWDGFWWDTNNGGSNTKQQGGHGDPDHFDAIQCVDCHDIALPPGTHMDGIYNSIWGNGSGTRNENTAHLKASFIGGTTPTWSVQLTLDNACWGCHNSIGGIWDMRHERDGVPAAGAVQFGTHLTESNGDARPLPVPNDFSWPGPYPVDQDISSNASGSTYYAPCISCHDPHGTGAPAKTTPSTSTNFMLRDNWQAPSILCKVCHP